jgi:hypothetical protein
MARAYAADDFEAIRARMAEIRRERGAPPAEKIERGACGGGPVRIQSTQGRRALRDMIINRRFRIGANRLEAGETEAARRECEWRK